MVSARLFLSAALTSCCLAASSACSGQQYNDLPGFPAQQSGCYPTTYYRTSDLGNTSPTDAKNRCEQQCTADSQCKSVVAQVNKAADQPNFYPSGTCFFYNSQNTPTGPRRCADTAYLLEGYYKDDTNACFSRSASAASAYCSSYLHIPVVTVTNTFTPPVVSTTSTTTTNPVPTTFTTNLLTSTVTVSANTLISTTVGTSTTTVTKTLTATTTTVVTVNAKRKRAAATVPAPACVTSNTPASRLSAACSCLSVSTSTTTTTKTLVPVTSSFTATTTVILSTNTVTLSSTVATVTATDIQTLFSSITAMVTVTATTTTTTTSTSTTTVGPACTSGVTSSTGNRYCQFYSSFGMQANNFQGGTPVLTGQSGVAASRQFCANLAISAPSFQVYYSNAASGWLCKVGTTNNCGATYTQKSDIESINQYELGASTCH